MPKGKTNNPNGRPKGSENKDKKALREKFDMLLSSYGVEKMIEDLKELSPKDRLNTLTNMAEFIMPKLQRSEVKQEITERKTEVFKIAGQTIEFNTGN